MLKGRRRAAMRAGHEKCIVDWQVIIDSPVRERIGGVVSLMEY